jgi:hypothetical protein
MSSEDWTEVGTIGVDSGSMLIVDPTYVDETYVAHGERHESEFVAGGETGGYGRGVFVTAGLGDGVYPVEVRYIQDPDFGRRIAEVRVRFLTD